MPAQDVFFEGIAGSTKARALVEQVQAICQELQVEVHHTWKTTDIHADLRVRARREQVPPLTQNVITMVWSPTNSHFRCETLLPAEICQSLHFPEDQIGDAVPQILDSTLFVRPDVAVDCATFLAIVIHSIYRFRRGF